MRKINKKISLGLAICLIASPVVTNLDTAYAQEIEESMEEDTLTFDDFQKEFEEFKKTDAYNFLDDEKKKELEESFSSINEENFGQESYDDFEKLLNSIELSYLSSIYNPLYEEVNELSKENLSDELKEKIKTFNPSYETFEEYKEAIGEIDILKDEIKDYNKNLKDQKALLKKGLDNSKSFDIDFEDEKKVLEDKNSNISQIDKAIESFNKKVDDYNKALDENSFVDLLKEITEKLEKEDKLSDDKKEYYVNKINKIREEGSVENIEELQNLKKELDKDLENKGGSVNEITVTKVNSDYEKDEGKNKDNKTKRKIAVKKTGDNKKGKNKKSRSIVRTGIKSVGVVGLVAVIAGGAYYFLSKKDK